MKRSKKSKKSKKKTITKQINPVSKLVFDARVSYMIAIAS